MTMPKKEYSDYKKFCEKQLQQGETIKTWGTGYIGEMMGSGDNRQYNGCLIITDRRVVFYSKGWLSEVFEEIPHTKISSIESKKIMGHTTLSIHTSGNTLKFKSLVPEEAKWLQDKVNELKGSNNTMTSSSSLAEPEDAFKKLEKLADLKIKGIISEDEFQVKKAELLKQVA